MKKIKKEIISILLSICFIISAFPCEASANTEKKCVSEKHYEYITDTNQIIEQVKIKNKELIENAKDDSLKLEFKQTISEKKYSDGTSETYSVVSTVTLLSASNNEENDAGTLIDVSYRKGDASKILAYTDNESKTKSWGIYDIACVYTIYYTSLYAEPNCTAGVIYKYGTFSFTDLGTNSVVVSKIQMYSKTSPDFYNEATVQVYYTKTYPSSGVIYTLNPNDNRILDGSGIGCIGDSGVIVTLSNGYVTPDTTFYFNVLNYL